MKIIPIALGVLFSNIILAQDIAGKWRGEFLLTGNVTAPFNFEIDKNSNVVLINGEERLSAGKATVRNDSLFISLDQFDNLLAFRIETPGKLTGVLRKQEGAEIISRVQAEKGKLYRFKKPGTKPLGNYSGKYEVVFTQESGRQYKAVGLFEQKGNKLLATFMKPSGDSRFQEGIVDGDRFYLSSFFGSSPGYYHGRFLSPGKFEGEQVATSSKQKIAGTLNANAALPDAYAVTGSKDSVFGFSLPDVDGHIVTLNDPKYRNKPVIIAITGTWCPNCMDETKFLSQWYSENKQRGIEIIAVHFERQNDTAFVRKVMTRYRDRFNIEYTQLFGGTTAREDISKALPGLNNFKSFPTTIFLDRQRRVVRIHAGFTGPATGKYYEKFIKDFNEQADQLISLH